MKRNEIELTNSELKVFQSAWFGLKDISSPKFMKIFEPIWFQNAGEIEEFSEKCKHPIELLKTMNVAFTLKPNITIGFNPENNSYLINLWYFLFCGDNQSIIIKPSIYLVSEFIHEHNHQKFCQKHDMICKDEVTTSRFNKKFHTEIEESAILEAIEFLKKGKDMVKDHLQVRSFRAKSWSENAVPICEIKNVTMCPDVKLESDIMRCNSTRKMLTSLSQDDFKKTMKKNKKTWYGKIARALDLSEPSLASPIAKWVYENGTKGES